MTTATQTEVPTISLAELRSELNEDKNLQLVEALPAEEFEKFHLPGAVNIPGDQVRAKAPELLPRKDQEIVVYCANVDCEASEKTTRILLDMGYENVRDFPGGKEAWKNAGLPVEGNDVG